MGFQLMTRVAPGEPPRERSASLPAAAPAVAPAAVAASNAASFPELRQALRRAAGNRDIEGLVEDLERLRREPSLKRALWAKLRTLRRSQ